jgi:hypothetical protein
MLEHPRKWATALSLGLIISLSPFYPANANEASAISASLSDLDVGDYVWKPEASSSGPVEIVVSLPLQAVYVYRGGTLIGLSTASTGRAGKETPTGSFEILQKRREHYSNLYDNAPMPFMQRLTWDGIALHGGRIPGYPASAGCVRLPNSFARKLFEVTSLGAWVHILDSTAGPEEALALIQSDDPIELASY